MDIELLQELIVDQQEIIKNKKYLPRSERYFLAV